jgi:hypothetical protein
MNKPVSSSPQPLKTLLGYLTFILVFFILTRTPQDADMWWHLRAGQEMWEQKTILLSDQFSYTRAGEPWTNAFWLSEIAFYLLYRTGGFFAISVFVSLVGGATFLLIYRRLSGNPFLNTAVLLLAAITAAPIWGPRPQIISFFLLAWLDKWLAERETGGNRPLWILVPLFAIWANLHGGWIWGFLLLSAHLVGAIIRTVLQASTPEAPPEQGWKNIGNLTLWTAAGALAVGLNPNGISLWRLPFHTLNVSLQIQEWLSPDFHRIDFHPMLWMIFLLLITARFAGPRPNWIALFKVIGFAYLTFISQRNIGPFAIVAAPVLSEWANAAVETLNKSRARLRSKQANKPLPSGAVILLNILIIGSLSAFALLRAYSLSMSEAVNEAVPSEAVAWIRKNRPQPQLFNSYNWGGYLIWSLPEYPVFIDGRADLYGDELIGEWRQIVNGTEKGLALLNERNVNLVLLEPGWPLIDELQLRGWELLYTDEKSVVYGRE